MMKKSNKRGIMFFSVMVVGILLISGFASSTSVTKENNSSKKLISTDGLKTAVFYSLENDGQLDRYQYILWGAGTYEQARNAKKAQEMYTNSVEICFGQDFIAGLPLHLYDVYVKRGFLYFNTAGNNSQLDGDVYIISAELTLYGRCKQFDKGGEHFDIYVQNGDNYPHDTLQKADYYYEHYQDSPNGVNTFNTKNFVYDYFDIKPNVLTLNRNGISWIKTSGNELTKFCLRSSRDVNAQWKDDGSEYISIWASETGGDYRPKLQVTYTTKPTVSISGPSEGTRNEKLTYTATATDPDGDNIVSYKWKVDGVESGSTSSITLQLGAGSHTVSVEVQDECGGWSDPAETTVSIDENRNPAMSSISPNSGKVRTDVTFTFTAQDDNYDNVKFKVEWGDDHKLTTSYFDNSDGQVSGTATHEYQLEGDYTIRVKAIDSEGGESDWKTISFATPRSRNIRLFALQSFFKQNYSFLIELVNSFI